jgi:hypothetical protein
VAVKSKKAYFFYLLLERVLERVGWFLAGGDKELFYRFCKKHLHISEETCNLAVRSLHDGTRSSTITRRMVRLALF